MNHLACRAFMSLILTASGAEQRQIREGQDGISMHSRRNKDIEGDTLILCQEFIKNLYEQSGRGQMAGSFLDAYDLVSAAITYICLMAPQMNASPAAAEGTATVWPPARSQQDLVPKLMEVVHKASTLITQISARFPAFEGIHRLLFTLASFNLDPKVSFPHNLFL